jgi:hypothetical protein
MKTIYVTHCSRDKNPEYEISGNDTTPDILYASRNLQKFIAWCRRENQSWAIFSDKYGVVFNDERIQWYNKPPDTVNADEFDHLLTSFTTRLSGFERIIFYHRPGETHPLFLKIVQLGRERGMNIIDFDASVLD